MDANNNQLAYKKMMVFVLLNHLFVQLSSMWLPMKIFDKGSKKTYKKDFYSSIKQPLFISFMQNI